MNSVSRQNQSNCVERQDQKQYQQSNCVERQDQKQDRQDRVERQDQTRLVGYVVNIVDPLNFQIDLNMNNPGISHTTYDYQEIDQFGIVRERTAMAYHCRLHNLKFKKVKRYNNLYEKIIQKINRQNRWVMCRIFGVDKYSRLIVELYDPVNFISLHELLLRPEYDLELYNKNYFV